MSFIASSLLPIPARHGANELVSLPQTSGASAPHVTEAGRVDGFAVTFVDAAAGSSRHVLLSKETSYHMGSCHTRQKKRGRRMRLPRSY
jgi:hypothetical protein